MSDAVATPVQTEDKSMSLGKAVTIYLGLLAGWIILWICSFYLTFLGLVPFVFYFVSGFVMNRIVLRRLVEWHPVYNTLSNVSKGKLIKFFLWPLMYPVLFFQLMVNKVL